MPRISNFHPFFGYGVFSTDKIVELIDKGEISWDGLTDEQIQPNTIDVRIGRVEVYSSNSRRSSPDEVEPDAVYEGKRDERIVIPSRSWASIDVHDKIGFDIGKYMMEVELRSGRGRLQLLPVDNINFMNIGMCKGINVFNMNPNDITLYGQDRFAQAFFYSSNDKFTDGKVVFDDDEIAEIAKRIGVQSLGPYLKLTPGDKVLEYKNIGGIDTRKKYGQDELFEKRDLPYRLGACEQVLMQSKEVMNVPNDIGVRLLRRVPTSQKSFSTGPDPEAFTPLRFVVNSGWVDSGYKGKITMHPFASLECILGEVEPTCLGIVYKYDKDVSKPYDGHYQNSKKIFNS